MTKPLILAPAGSEGSFFAAIAAGADAVYCGLKIFSARMEAANFTIEQLIPLVKLAHKKGIKVYITLNSILKSDDLDKAEEILINLEKDVKPDAIIIQDIAFIKIARKINFSGEIHLSTLANLSFADGLNLVHKKLKVDKVVIPRELNIDEIKLMAQACPENLDLEMFVHGALCYGVSGRCYWSSYFGGKSGLRGRCVQPCRRFYSQEKAAGKFFSCIDLSLDTLTKIIFPIPQIGVWKIEGRKKGPHYVYYTVSAYKILRDSISDSKMKKVAVDLLDQALGRPVSHYNFLPQRPYNPIREKSQTGSGLFIGKVSGSRQSPYIITREALLANDVLRIGYEDEPWHSIHKSGRYVPKNGHYNFKLQGKKFKAGAPVFLVDRREKELQKKLEDLEKDLNKIKKNLHINIETLKKEPEIEINYKKKYKKKSPIIDLNVYRGYGRKNPSRNIGLWLSPLIIEKYANLYLNKIWWWLPPVVWPEDENEIKDSLTRLLKKGYKNFVVNAPWQISFFKNHDAINVWAGPFCNLASYLSVNTVAGLGISGAIISPELGKDDYLSLPEKCTIPLGIVLSGNWPLSISRIVSEEIKLDQLFYSPKKEAAWVKKYGPLFWIYPNWKINLTDKKKILLKAGYNMFINFVEPVPKNISLKKRPGLWNWDIGLS